MTDSSLQAEFWQESKDTSKQTEAVAYMSQADNVLLMVMLLKSKEHTSNRTM